MDLPRAEDLELQPRAVVWHWTAGTHRANAVDRSSYHFLAEHRGDRVVPVAAVPIERNMRSLSGVPSYRREPGRGYAAHCGGLNTRTIGLALCGMTGAADHRPSGDVTPGRYPITLLQVRWLLGMSATLARAYDLEVTERTFLGHHEVRRVYGAGSAKWDVSFIPGLGLDASEAGPFLREQLARWLRGDPIDDRIHAPPEGGDRDEALEGDEVP